MPTMACLQHIFLSHPQQSVGLSSPDLLWKYFLHFGSKQEDPRALQAGCDTLRNVQPSSGQNSFLALLVLAGPPKGPPLCTAVALRWQLPPPAFRC